MKARPFDGGVVVLRRSLFEHRHPVVRLAAYSLVRGLSRSIAIRHFCLGRNFRRGRTAWPLLLGLRRPRRMTA